LDILLAEEASNIDRALITALETCGARVRTVGNGLEAVEILSHDSFDLVVTDTHMPIMSGDEVIRHVRGSEGPNRDVPIIALAAAGQAQSMQNYLDLGANATLTKPLDLEALRGAIAEFRGRVGSRAA
jgi:CheY-like chemotaxis protein